MTVEGTNRVAGYNINIALNLLGPANFGVQTPQNCMEHLILIINRIAFSIFRMINFLCGDHRWYDCQTARLIIEQYCEDPARDPALEARVRQLHDALMVRGSNNVSYAEGLEEVLSRLQEAREISNESSQRSHQMGFSEIFALCEDQLLEGLPVQEDLQDRSLLSFMIENATATILNLAHNSQDAEKVRDAVCELAQIQAKTNLEQSLATADQLESVPRKVALLSTIAKIRSVINLEEAKEVFEKAYRLAGSIIGEADRIQAFCDLASAEARLSPEQALIALDHIPSFMGEKDILYSEIAKSLAPSDLVHALEVIEFISQEQVQDKALSAMVSAQNLSGIELAADIAERIQAPENKVSALCRIACLEGLFHTERAQALLDQAIQEADSLRGALKDIALCEIIKVQACYDLIQAQAIFAQIQDPMRKSLAMQGMVQSPLMRLESNFRDILPQALALPNAPPRDKTLFEIVKIQLRQDVESALATAHEIHNAKEKALAFSTICQKIAETDQGRALQLTDEVEDKAIAAYVLCQLAEAEAQANRLESFEEIAQKAFDTANLISNEAVKGAVFCLFAKAKAVAHPEQFWDFFQPVIGFQYLSINNSDQENDLLCLVAKMLTSHNPNYAAQPLGVAYHEANRLKDPETKSRCLKKILATACDTQTLLIQS